MTHADFAMQHVRMGFIRKVYGILSAQLAVTLGVTLLFTYSESVARYAFEHPGMIWSAYIMTIVCIIVLACCGNVRRSYPANYIFLGIFTLCESYLVGVISATYETQVVLLALVITMAVTIGLTLFAFQTKYDFTMMGGVLYSALLVLILLGFINIFWHGNRMTTVYAAFGALVFAAYLVYDTQLLMGGKHKKYQISPDEYVFAALNLYLDIINLFLYILALLGNRR